MSVPPNLSDYDTARRTFRLEVPERFNYGRDVVDARAEREPDALALVTAGPDGAATGRYSCADLAERSNRAANALHALGVGPGDPVLVMLPRIVEWYDVLLGLIKIGAVPIPATTQLQPRDIAYRLNAADGVAVVTDAENAAKVDAVASECPSLRLRVAVGDAGEGWTALGAAAAAAPDGPPTVAPTRAEDPMILFFTSGTTGGAKMVLHTQSYGIGHDVTAALWQDLRRGDLHWTVSDTGWAKAAWGMLFGQLRAGAAVFVWDGRGRPDFPMLLRMIADHGVTTFCAPPTVYRHLVLLDLSEFELPTLRHCVAAGEPLDPETMAAWRRGTGLDILDGYGQTETVNVIANYRAVPRRPGSMGKAVPGWDVAVVDESGDRLPAGEEGHIAIRTRPERPCGLFREYWRDEERTAEVFRGDWYYTGDRGVLDEDGYFWFVSRADDVIISAGYRIGPFEVESAVIEHPAVAEVAVVGAPDSERGQVVKAFVVLAPGHEPSDDLARGIQDHVKSVTAPYKYPRRIEFVADLPKTISGKIRRVELRAREAAGAQAEEGSAR
jgi:acyl-coenzyme A synthetase/AMP-(fatty) acid ligase